MRRLSKYNLKKDMNNILLFFFFMFAVSDLVELHLRIFFNTETSINYNISGKTSKTHVKVKDGKKRAKPSNHGGIPDFTFQESSLKSCDFVTYFAVILPNFLLLRDIVLQDIIIPRAPPIA